MLTSDALMRRKHILEEALRETRIRLNEVLHDDMRFLSLKGEIKIVEREIGAISSAIDAYKTAKET